MFMQCFHPDILGKNMFTIHIPEFLVPLADFIIIMYIAIAYLIT